MIMEQIPLPPLLAHHESTILYVCTTHKPRMSKYLTSAISKHFIIYLLDGLRYITFSLSLPFLFLRSCGLSRGSTSAAAAKLDWAQKMRSDLINMTKDRLHWAFLRV